MRSIWRMRLRGQRLYLPTIFTVAMAATAPVQAQPASGAAGDPISQAAAATASAQTQPAAPTGGLPTSHIGQSSSGKPADTREGAASGLANQYDYVLGAGDKLRIIVFGEEALTGEFFVAGNGTLAFPLIGQVQAAGKTVGQLQTLISAQLANGYLKDPRVSAQVEIFRPYFILGEIAKPGEYPYIDGMTVINAVATAGGFSYRANQKYVMLKRANEPTPEKVKLTEQLQLAPGDTVRVIERYF